MAILDDVATMAFELAEVTEVLHHGRRTWQVAGKGFAWERPLSKADRKRLGEAPMPQDPMLAVMVADLGEREAVLAENRPGLFTIEHFSNYPAMLVELPVVSDADLREVLLDAWLACAPARLTEKYLEP